MKKSLKKLALNRETVLHLERIAKARGGVFHQDPSIDTCTTGPGGGPIYTGPFYPGCPSYGNYCTMYC